MTGWTSNAMDCFSRYIWYNGRTYQVPETCAACGAKIGDVVSMFTFDGDPHAYPCGVECQACGVHNPIVGLWFAETTNANIN